MNKANQIVTKPLSGFMELLPADQIAFNKMMNIIRHTYEAFGFLPMDNPVLERAEVVLAKAGGETEQQIYQFQKGDNHLAMRFDLTVPLARFVAENYGKLAFPFRRYAIGKSYRGERPQAGRFREFYQCDIDVIGDSELDISFDAELPSIIYMIFRELGFERFTIRVNNRKLFNGLFAELGLVEKATNIMQAIDRLEKVGLEAVKKELVELELSSEQISQIFNFTNIKGNCAEVIEKLKGLEIKDAQFSLGLHELEQFVRIIKQLGVPETNFVIDVTIARGLGYYTGTVYETKLDDYPEIGSVCSGGRYDDLASHYINRKLPGVGISIGLTRLFDQLSKRGLIKNDQATLTKVVIVPMMENIEPCLKLATRLRINKIPTEMVYSQGKMKKQLSYANKMGIPYAIFIGENEMLKGVVTLKDLNSGKQEELKEEELLLRLKN